jgi:hypothetical protein
LPAHCHKAVAGRFVIATIRAWNALNVNFRNPVPQTA